MNTYKEFCENLIKQLFDTIQKDGLADWQKGWNKEATNKLPQGVSGLYKGVNLLSLMLAQKVAGFSSNQWLTFNQVSKLGGQVKKGSKAEKIVYWNIAVVTSEEDEISKKLYSKMYSVFNLEQTTLNEDQIPTFDKNITIDQMLNNCNVTISHFGGRAYYAPEQDCIIMPLEASFMSHENYYATLLHELVHWTGAETRLNRDTVKNYGHDIKARAQEELTAEIGSLFLNSYFSVNGNIEQHASYVESWKSVLSEKEIMRSIKKASEAFMWLIGEKVAQ